MSECLRVIHFDRDAPEVPSEPTPLAPWSTWLTGNYRPCRNAGRFRDELAQASGPTIVLLHLTDLESKLESGEFDQWLDADTLVLHGRPRRHIVVYGGIWTGHGNFSAQIAPRLPAQHCPLRWMTVPAWFLASPASPVAWLAHPLSYLSLDEVSQPFEAWRQKAADKLLLASKGTPGICYRDGQTERLFLRNVITQILQHTLLSHALRAGLNNPRQRTHTERRHRLLDCGDVLWLLEGVAESLFWHRSVRLINCARTKLQRAMQTPNFDWDDQDNPSNRDTWQDLIDGIQKCIEEEQNDG